MDNYTFTLNEQNIEQELRCIVCLCMPEDPLQCVGCDSIMCRECCDSMKSTRKCPMKCHNPHYTKVKPKTMMLFDCLKIRCEDCEQTFPSLEYAKHQKFCGKKSYTKKDLEYRYRPTDAHLHVPRRSDNLRLQENDFSQDFSYLSRPLINPPASNPHNGVYNSSQSNTESNSRIDIPNNQQQNIKRSFGWWICLFIVGMISGTGIVFSAILGYNLIITNTNGEFEWFCLNNFGGEKCPICFIAVGPASVGIFAFGQLAVGFFTLSQVGIGLFFGVGQLVLGCGVTIAQVTNSVYVYAAQGGLGFWKVNHASGVFQFLYSLWTKKDIYVKNCGDNSNRSRNS